MAFNFEGGSDDSSAWGLEPMAGGQEKRAETFAEEVERLNRERGLSYIPENTPSMEMLGDRSDYASAMMSEEQAAEAERRSPKDWTLE